MAKIPTFEEFLGRTVPEEKQHLLVRKVEDYRLAKLAKKVGQWENIAPFLGLEEADEEEIKEDKDTAERRRLVPCIFGSSVSLMKTCPNTYHF